MNAPYRDASVADDHEPIPQLSVDLKLWRNVFAYVAYMAVWALVAARDNVELATVLRIVSIPGLVVLVLLAMLYEPMGRWLAARHARAVIEGVAALEAEVSACE